MSLDPIDLVGVGRRQFERRPRDLDFDPALLANGEWIVLAVVVIVRQRLGRLLAREGVGIAQPIFFFVEITGDGLGVADELGDRRGH
jgi:hypothetical protein